jgi:hypothetical protein
MFLLAALLGGASACASGDEAACPAGDGAAACGQGIAPELELADEVAPAVVGSTAHPRVIHDGGVRLILSAAPEESWSQGDPEVLALDEPVLVSRALAVESIPAEKLAWAGKHVTLMGAKGEVCRGTVESLAMLGRVAPHFGTLARWRGEREGDDTDDEPLPSAREIADEAWSEAADGLVLTGVVRSSGDCTGALWAQPSSERAPVVAAAEEADSAMKASALEQLRALPEYAEIQAQYLEEMDRRDAEVDAESDANEPPPAPHAARWEDGRDEELDVRVMRHPSGTLVWASLAVEGGCGEFNGAMGVVFSVGPRGQLSLVSDPDVTLGVRPEAAADIDGDGRVELLLREGTVRQENGFFTEEESFEVLSHDCPC